MVIFPPDRSRLDGSKLILNLPVFEIRLELPRTSKVAAAFAVKVAPLPPWLVTLPIVMFPLVALLASKEVFMLPAKIGALT